MRLGAEKVLVDAILDGQLDAQELANEAGNLGGTLGQKLTLITRGIFLRAKQRRLSTDQALNAYRLAYISLALGGFTSVAQKVMDQAQRDVAAVKKAIKAVGKDLSKVSAIRDVDKMNRMAERKGTVDGG